MARLVMYCSALRVLTAGGSSLGAPQIVLAMPGDDLASRGAVARMIDIDPLIRAQDVPFDARWRTASPLTRYPNALRADSTAWLRKRVGCAADACGLRRISAKRSTESNTATIAGAFAWPGMWNRISDNGFLAPFVDAPVAAGTDCCRNRLPAETCFGHLDVLDEGEAAVTEGRVLFAMDVSSDSPDRTMVLQPVHRQSVIRRSGCSTWNTPAFVGRCAPAIAGAVQWDLLNSDVMADAPNAAVVQRLIGVQQYGAVLKPSVHAPVAGGASDTRIDGSADCGHAGGEALLPQMPNGEAAIAVCHRSGADGGAVHFYSRTSADEDIPEIASQWAQPLPSAPTVVRKAAGGSLIEWERATL